MSNEEPADRKSVIPSGGSSLSKASSDLVRRGLDSIRSGQLRTLHFPNNRSMGDLYDYEIPLRGGFTPREEHEFERIVCADDEEEGISIDEIARRLKMSPDRVAHVLNKAKQLQRWKLRAKASGDVEVPYSQVITLLSGRDHSFDLSPLAQLKVDDLQGLLLCGAQNSDRELVHIRNLAGLRYLDLALSSVTDIGLTHIEGLTALADLNLSSTAVSDKGMKHLVHLSSLARLELTHTTITDAGLKQLGNIPSLRYLWLNFTHVTVDGVRELKRTLPLCYIDLEWLNGFETDFKLDKTTKYRIKLDERTIARQLLSAMRGQVPVKEVQELLAEAQKHGHDPAKLYREAVARRPNHSKPAPPFEDVAPESSKP